MAKKNNKKSRNAAGKLKKVNKPNPKRKEKQRELHSQKFAKYQIKKAEEQQAKDTMARQAALEKMGMPVEQQNFGYEDHRAIYNYAQERGPHHQPPIRTIDASVAPPEVTSYPEYPRLEFSSPPAFDIHGHGKVALNFKKETVLNATESRGFARLVRAKKIFYSSKLI
jgi:NAD-dependent DNA ligase